MQRLMTNKCAGQVVFWASLTFLMQAIGADIPQKSAEGCASNKLEILQNGNFDEIVPFEKNIEKWDIVGKKLPKSWVPVYSYGEAKSEVVPIANGSTNYELRLAHGALAVTLFTSRSCKKTVEVRKSTVTINQVTKNKARV